MVIKKKNCHLLSTILHYFISYSKLSYEYTIHPFTDVETEAYIGNWESQILSMARLTRLKPKLEVPEPILYLITRSSYL